MDNIQQTKNWTQKFSHYKFGLKNSNLDSSSTLHTCKKNEGGSTNLKQEQNNKVEQEEQGARSSKKVPKQRGWVKGVEQQNHEHSKILEQRGQARGREVKQVKQEK